MTDREPADVVWIGHSTEDTADSVIVPRFLAAGGDPERLHILATDVDVSLSQACVAAGGVAPALVVIDSWAAWGADAAKDSGAEAADRYRAMDKLRASGAAVLAIMHDRKGEAGEEDATVTAVAGSMQTTAKPRTVLRVKGGLLSSLKGNISGRADSIAFMVEGVAMDLHGVHLEDVPRVEWDTRPIQAGYSPETPDGDGGGGSLTVEELADHITAQTDPPTAHAIRRCLNMDTKRKRLTVDRLLALSIKRGLVRQVPVKINGRERIGFEAMPDKTEHQVHPVPDAPDATDEGASGASGTVVRTPCRMQPDAPVAADADVQPAIFVPDALAVPAFDPSQAFDRDALRAQEGDNVDIMQTLTESREQGATMPAATLELMHAFMGGDDDVTEALRVALDSMPGGVEGGVLEICRPSQVAVYRTAPLLDYPDMRQRARKLYAEPKGQQA